MLHKSSEIQWNITGTLPRKLKRKIFWLYTTRYPVSNYGFEVNNRNTRTRCEICWKLTIKILWTYFTPCYSVSIVNFEHVYASWVLPPEITKTWEIAFFWGGESTLEAWESMWNSMAFYDFVNFWKIQPLSFG